MSHSYDHALTDLVYLLDSVYELTLEERDALHDRLRPIIVEAVEAAQRRASTSALKGSPASTPSEQEPR